MSCLTDPTGITNGILTITTKYDDGDSQCHGSPNNIDSQSSDLFTVWPTYCSEDSGKSVRYRCINLPNDQLPFKVDDANTIVTV